MAAAARIFAQAVGLGLAAVTAGFVHSRIRPIDLSFSSSPASATPVEPAAPTDPAASDPKPAPPARPADAPQTPAPAAPAPSPSVHVTPPPPAPKPAKEGFIDLERARAMVAARNQIIDARDAREYLAGHLPGAINMPLSSFDGGRLPEIIFALDRSAPTLIYCGGGNCETSVYVAIKLKEQGFTNLAVYEGGYTEWTSSGGTVETGGVMP